MNVVGETIRELRKKRSLSQDELAELANLNRVTVAKYESGKIEPGAQALSRIADALEVTVDELLGRSVESMREGAFTNPDLAMLFDLMKHADPDDVRDTIRYARFLQGERENG